MAAFNKVILIGNLTRDVELRKAGSTSVCDLGLAVNDKRKDSSGQWVDDVCFVDCTVFGRTAEVVNEYASKGSTILIEGKLKLETWEDKTSGQKRSKLKVIADKVQLLDQRGGEKPQRQAKTDEPKATRSRAQSPSNTEDIPF